jgi:hypothetical protein
MASVHLATMQLLGFLAESLNLAVGNLWLLMLLSSKMQLWSVSKTARCVLFLFTRHSGGKIAHEYQKLVNKEVGFEIP